MTVGLTLENLYREGICVFACCVYLCAGCRDFSKGRSLRYGICNVTVELTLENVCRVFCDVVCV